MKIGESIYSYNLRKGNLDAEQQERKGYHLIAKELRDAENKFKEDYAKRKVEREKRKVFVQARNVQNRSFFNEERAVYNSVKKDVLSHNWKRPRMKREWEEFGHSPGEQSRFISHQISTKNVGMSKHIAEKLRPFRQTNFRVRGTYEAILSELIYYESNPRHLESEDIEPLHKLIECTTKAEKE